MAAITFIQRRPWTVLTVVVSVALALALVYLNATQAPAVHAPSSGAVTEPAPRVVSSQASLPKPPESAAFTADEERAALATVEADGDIREGIGSRRHQLEAVVEAKPQEGPCTEVRCAKLIIGVFDDKGERQGLHVSVDMSGTPHHIAEVQWWEPGVVDYCGCKFN